MDDSIVQQQGLEGRPQIEGLVEGTNLIVPPIRAADRLAHFSSDVYDLSAESHLVRFLKTMLGDAGAGRLSKSGLLARLEQSLQGTHFFDLDAFYGALFGLQRRASEVIEGDPFTDVFTDDEWDEIAARDDSYRCRIEQFARAINYGATPTGMQLMAEALLGVECDVYESFLTQDRSILTYADLEAEGTYGDLELLGTYGDLESDGEQPSASFKRALFTVVPKRPITDEEQYDLIRVLSVLKPASSVLRVSPMGRPTLTDVAIRGVAADSEMWKVRKSTINDGQVDPKKRPPFTSYQGEAWTHLGSVLGVTSYNLNEDGTTNNWGLVGVVKVGGTIYTYTPDLALIPLNLVLSGRAVSDGIVVRHPYRSAPRNRIPFYWSEPYYQIAGEFDPTKVSGIYETGFWADGYAIVDQGQKILFSGHQKTRQTFWATPERPQSDNRGEVIEIKLRSTQLVNHLSFDLSRYPATARAEAWDEEISGWRTLRTWTVTESFPQRIGRTQAISDYHPQHGSPEHWLKCSDSVSAVRTQRIRIILKRNQLGIAPLGPNGKPVPYSLALRSLDIGYRLRGRSDIPEPDESLGGIIATTYDATGRAMAMDVAENPAENALLNGTASWRSEPQPTNRAVVSYYLDVRQPDGSAQVIDTLYLNPVRSGPAMNLYWSNDEGFGAFAAPDRPIDYSTVGPVDSTARGVVLDDGDGSWIEISNDEVQFDPSLDDWWLGCQFTTKVPTVAAGMRVLAADEGHLRIEMGLDPSDGNSKVSVTALNSNDSEVAYAEAALDAPAGRSVTVAVRYSREDGRLYIETSVDGVVSSGSSAVTGEMVRPDRLLIGGADGYLGTNITITGFFLKVGIQANEIDSMAEDFQSYVLRKAPGSPTNDFTTNAIIRYHPSFSSVDRIGIRGGIADLWAARIWHPIERDYKLTKGYVHLPPTRAKFWKLEFTNLAAEPMESMLPISRHVRVFPSDVSGINDATDLRPVGGQWPGLRPAMTAATSTPFRDTPPNFNRVMARELPPTAAQYVPEIQRAKQMREQFSWLYGMQPWQAGHAAPRFREVGPHAYNEFDLIDTAKVGFFVGLAEVRALRTDYERDDDTPIYYERFLDDSQWVDGYTWNLDPGQFFTIAADATATSRVFRSRHAVRAIQFAAHQSDAVQIIPDDSFSSAELAESAWDDDTKWHRSGDGQILYRQTDQVVVVSRDVQAMGGNQNYISFPPDPAMDDVYRSPDGLLSWKWDGSAWVRIGSSIMGRTLAPVFSFRTSSAVPVSQSSGGIESGLSSTSAEGMIHAAARVTAVTDTVNPLVLQIIGSDDSVLAEEQVFLRAGETKEWYVSYQLGSFDRPSYQLYEAQTLLNGGAPASEQYGIMRPVWDHSTPGTTGETPSVAPDSLVRVRLVQEGASKDSWAVDRLSIFDDSILWEFSVDGGSSWHKALNIRSNPNGVLTFPRPSNGLCWRVTSYRQRRVITSLQVRPWYVGQMGTVMGVPHRGPNVSSFDHEPPINLDPEFKVWSRPVPRWWWREGQRFPILPGPGEPLTNPYSDFFSRTATDGIDAPTGEALSVMSAARSNSDGLDGDGFPAIGTPLPTPADAATTGGGIYTRSSSSSLPAPDDSEYVSRPEDDALMRPPLSPPPTTGD